MLIIPSIAFSIWKEKNSYEKFIAGIQNKDVLAMCIIFLLSGAFTSITSEIKSIDSVINIVLYFIQPKYLLISIFLTAAFVSTAIGTSMGTIATLGPIIQKLIQIEILPASLGAATLISGAMFGDSLSLISDTTIAAINSQGADPKKKFLLNFKIAIVAGIITLLILIHKSRTIDYAAPLGDGLNFNLILIIPYLVIFFAAFLHMHVFKVLFLGICSGFFVAFYTQPYSIFLLNKNIIDGFSSMFEITLLSLAIGGLSNLMNEGINKITEKLEFFIIKTKNQKKNTSIIIAGIVSLFDILLANNTIAIILSGDIARKLTTKLNIPQEKTAVVLDVFSCVFQGILPYGAQVLLASKFANLSPLIIFKEVYFCYTLFFVMISYLIFSSEK